MLGRLRYVKVIGIIYQYMVLNAFDGCKNPFYNTKYSLEYLVTDGSLLHKLPILLFYQSVT